MNKWYLYLGIGLLLVGGGFYAGYSNRQVTTDREVVVQEKEVVVQKEAEVKWRERIVTVEKIVRPDGTVEERTIDHSQELDKATKELAQTKEQLTKERERKIITPALSKYSLGVQVPLKFSEEPTKMFSVYDVSFLLGVRLLGPLWVEGSFSPSSKETTIGVRWEF